MIEPTNLRFKKDRQGYLLDCINFAYGGSWDRTFHIVGRVKLHSSGEIFRITRIDSKLRNPELFCRALGTHVLDGGQIRVSYKTKDDLCQYDFLGGKLIRTIFRWVRGKSVKVKSRRELEPIIPF
jgi:hypothetical protein